MKPSFFFTLILLISFVYGQEGQDKPFATTSNRYYIGASVSPTFVALLNGENNQAEWKLAYKQRLHSKNHFLRLSYSYILDQRNYAPLGVYFDNRQTISLNDSMEWTSGSYKNRNNFQSLKMGYEYQFKIGQKRSLSVNMGSDFLVGFNGGKIFYANDTLTYRNEFIDGTLYRNIAGIQGSSEVLRRAQVFYGFSPFIALGVPLKKRFDLTFEMSFDYAASIGNANNGNVSTRNLNYRPSLMLSYRFDEAHTKRKGRESRTSR